MISIGKVRDPDYYLSEVEADDSAGYYHAGAAPSRWLGRLAEVLELSGPVDPGAFAAVLDGRRPDGARLTEHPTTTRALDVTLSVPKSISVLWALGTSEERAQVLDALDHTEAAVVELLEQEATRVRRGHGGVDLQQGSGLLIASFDHRTSRLGDPNLHRHLVVANSSVGPDGRWTALDTRQLYRIRYTAEAVFQAVLRYELGRRLGVGFTTPDRHGAAEIGGVPTRVLKAFSRRRQEIVAEMSWRGVTTGRGARTAALATRRPKPDPAASVWLEQDWRERASALGFDPHRIQKPGPPHLTPHDDAGAAALVTEQDATFTRWDALRAVSRLATTGAALHQLLHRTDILLASPEVVQLTSERFTTPEILELEQRSVTLAVEGQGVGVGVVGAEVIGAALAARLRLSGEQRQLVQRVAGSGDAVSVVIGQAGAGKTTALDAVHDAYRRAGLRVIGAALSARAAAELQAGTGIPSRTLHRVLSVLRRDRWAIDAHTVLVVDEAAMVGTRQLAALVEAAHVAGAKVVLVGDPGQLPEIEAGGTFSAIARRVRPSRLTENRRQQRPEHRDALTALRRADIDRALDNLERAGDLTTGPDADTVRTALVADWLSAALAGRQAIMLAANRGDVADLNRRALEQLKLAGHLGSPVWSSDRLTLHAGDRVLAHRNRRDLGILNGDRGVVRHARRNRVRVELDRGTLVEVPAGFIDAGHLTHGYALTVHKAQGLTCDHAYFLGDDGLFNELAYTGLSRGRHTNHLYAVAARDEYGYPLPDPFIEVRRSLAISRAKTAAIELEPDVPDLP